MQLTASSPFLSSLRTIARPSASVCRASQYQELQLQTQVRRISQAWKQRQAGDAFAREARVKGLKSRAAFKLLEIDSKYRLFKKGQTVVDLGFAPGSWSQVALDRTRPGSSVIGIDLIPAQPPRGVAAFQGDFLSPKVQMMVKSFVLQVYKQRKPPPLAPEEAPATADGETTSEGVVLEQYSYIDMERHAAADSPDEKSDQKPTDYSKMNLVDVVLSDMSEPWDQITGFGSNTLSNPYIRLMNTSGNTFRDHAGSMDLCNAALQFASDTLKPGGHFVCKFYQGSEDKALERKLQTLFSRVHRDKPEASRKESKEGYFIGIRRKAGVTL